MNERQKIQPTTLNFIHIPKCGGTTFRSIYNLNNEQAPEHWNAKPIQNKINVAIIRNPYSRIQSIFAHAKDRYNKLTNIKFFDSLNDLAKAYFNIHHPHHIIAIAMFDWSTIKLQHQKPSIKHICVDDFGNLIHFATQSVFVTTPQSWGNDTPILFLRLEYLSYDLQRYINNGNLPGIPVDSNIEEIRNQSSNKNKTRAQITPIIEKLVRIVYKQDLDLYEKIFGHPAFIN